MTDHIFSLLPLYPDTDTKLTLATDRSSNEFQSLKVDSWRRLYENKNVVQVEAYQNINYQCTPLDAFSCIEVRLSYKYMGKLINSKLVSKPVQVKNQLKQMLLYDPEPVKARVLLDNFQTFMTLCITNQKMRFFSEIGKYDLLLDESSIEADPNPVILKVNFHTQKNQFMQFFSNSIKVGGKFRSSFCIAVFPSKSSKDMFCCQIATLFRDLKSNSQNNIKIIETSPRIDQKKLKNDHSASSLTSINKSKQKQRQKVKISERLNMKKSSTNTKPNTSKIDNSSRQCLNIFQEDDYPMENSKTTQNVLNDMSMDLRGSFDELEQLGTSKLDQDMSFDKSFQQKKGNWLNPIDQENKKLRQQNQRLKKQLQGMGKLQKQLGVIKKKYSAVVEQNNRLENQRRAIITDKVRFQSLYHKQLQQKQALRRELQYGRAPTSPQYGMRRI